jgi:sec-independent protein translocase protein TatA
MMGISIPSLILILVIVLLLFGTKRLKNVGSDLGGAIKGFRKAMKDGVGVVDKGEAEQLEKKEDDNVIEGEVTKEKDKV